MLHSLAPFCLLDILTLWFSCVPSTRANKDPPIVVDIYVIRGSQHQQLCLRFRTPNSYDRDIDVHKWQRPAVSLTDKHIIKYFIAAILGANSLYSRGSSPIFANFSNWTYDHETRGLDAQWWKKIRKK